MSDTEGRHPTPESGDEFEDRLGDLAKEHYNPPPPAPIDRMWARIEAERDDVTMAEPGMPVSGRGADGQRRWLRWGLAAAAVLAVGIGLGRLSTSLGPAPDAEPVARGPEVVETPTLEESADAGLPYQLAAGRHLGQVEALLTWWGESEDAEAWNELAPTAGQLLSKTRLFLDSPAGSDPELRRLLEELELFLAQIAQPPTTDVPYERELIADGIESGDLLLRLRAATPRGRPLVRT